MMTQDDTPPDRPPRTGVRAASPAERHRDHGPVTGPLHADACAAGRERYGQPPTC
ncbi:hypothetical protein ACOQFV_24695 [Nocardiopsis changdeensis]|uniref:Uncharacterized protein n=1 Tax=Nocardiopsis changdeensis TaxID=2831969 RepID=A0A975QCL3_9ACTN|nr:MULTISPECIES: hypothetical protein [Nocardiopsis]QUX26410.1 hypothetical protein KGD84_32445 [Nocardiopsis changdeensis]QYX40682.1 hypothetical protein K1J57_32295 [Nocardiopsis sp. MT53]